MPVPVPVPGSVLVATANVLYSLGDREAAAAVDGLLEHAPDLVALQEWRLSRWRLLDRRGGVRLVPGGLPLGRGAPAHGERGPGGYTWSTALVGGCAVGARTERFRPTGAALRLLSGPGRADRGSRDVPVRPPRWALVATFLDLERGTSVTFVSYHLMPAVQRAGRYREDRPLLVGAHRQEVRALDRVLDRHRQRGDVVLAAGDSNFDGLRLAGAHSAWEGRDDHPGTFGRRRIDDVHGPAPAASVTLLRNASDHKAVLARVPLG